MSSSNRRALVAMLAASASLAACGFKLRGQFNYAFTRVFVQAPAYAAFATELRRALSDTQGVTIADSAAAAQVVVEITAIVEDKQVLSLSPGGRVQEYALSKAVAYRVRDPQGRDWLRPDEIIARRTYTYDDSERLAREIQERRLFRDMQTDAVQQIVRRLQFATPPA